MQYNNYIIINNNIIRFNDNFNESPIFNNDSNSITKLIFGNDFNQPIDNLPNSIIDLYLGYRK